MKRQALLIAISTLAFNACGTHSDKQSTPVQPKTNQDSHGPSIDWITLQSQIATVRELFVGQRTEPLNLERCGQIGRSIGKAIALGSLVSELFQTESYANTATLQRKAGLLAHSLASEDGCEVQDFEFYKRVFISMADEFDQFVSNLK